MRGERRYVRARMQDQLQSQTQGQGQPGVPGQMDGSQQRGMAAVPSVGQQQLYQPAQVTQPAAHIKQQQQQPTQQQPQPQPQLQLSSGQNQNPVIHPSVAQHHQHPLQMQQHLQQNQGAGSPSFNLAQLSNSQQYQGGPAGVQAGAQQRLLSQCQLPIMVQLPQMFSEYSKVLCPLAQLKDRVASGRGANVAGNTASAEADVQQQQPQGGAPAQSQEQAQRQGQAYSHLPYQQQPPQPAPPAQQPGVPLSQISTRTQRQSQHMPLQQQQQPPAPQQSQPKQPQPSQQRPPEALRITWTTNLEPQTYVMDLNDWPVISSPSGPASTNLTKAKALAAPAKGKPQPKRRVSKIPNQP